VLPGEHAVDFAFDEEESGETVEAISENQRYGGVK